MESKNEDQSKQQDQEESKAQVEEEEIQLTEKDCEYKLVGVVIHMGTADAGHYISYINVDRQADSSINTEEWLKTENQ